MRTLHAGAALICWCWVGSWLVGCGPAPPAQPLPPPRLDASRDRFRDGKLVLGSPSLTAGLPGAGPLTPAELAAWLADPENHRPLAVTPPLGLHVIVDRAPPHAWRSFTRAKIELGRQLFFDRRLSRLGSLSCGDCHLPQLAYTSFVGRGERLRDPAVAFNRLFSTRQFWDGKAESLEAQPATPLANEHELNLPPAEAVARLGQVPGYRLQFDKLFGRLDEAALGEALAAFVRVLTTGPAAHDYLTVKETLSARRTALTPEERELLAEAEAGLRERLLTAAELRGRAIFFSDRAGCAVCHEGPNFTDEQFHRLGDSPLREREGRLQRDPGRFGVTGNPADRYAFKTPTLRNLAKTSPYLHDGRFDALGQVLEWKARGGDPGESELIPLDLSPAELRELEDFLLSLDSPLPPVATDRLPE